MRSAWPRNLVTRLESSRLVVYSLISGALVGLAGLLLRWVLSWLSEGAYRAIGYRPPGTPGEGGLMMSFGALMPLGLVLLVVTALLVALFGGRNRDPLEDDVAAYHGAEPPARPLALGRTLLVQALAGGAGLLVGRDALYALMGALVSRLGWRALRLDAASAQTLALASVGAGMGLALHAPLAAAVLVAEALYRRFEFELELLLPAVLASIAAYAVYGSVFGFSPLFTVPDFTLDARSWLLYAALALAISLIAWLAVRLGAQRLWAGRWQGRALLALVYGVVTALLFTQIPQVLGDGSGWLQLGLSGLSGSEALWQGLLRVGLLVLAVWGGLGQGVLPAVSAGGLIGVGVAALWPGLGLDPAVAGLVGAAVFVTVTHNAPIAATLLAVAWGGDAVLPVAFIGTLLAHLISGEVSLIGSQVRTRSASGAHGLPAPLVSPSPLPETPEAFSPEPSDGDSELHRLACPPAWVGQPLGEVRWPPGVELVGLVYAGAVQDPLPDHLLDRSDELLLLAAPLTFGQLTEAIGMTPVSSGAHP